MRGEGQWVVTRGGLVHVKRHAGHRESYQRLFCDLLGLTPSTGSAWRRFRSLVAAPYVLFATLDGEDVAFLTVALIRAALGRPTVAFFLRPQGCFAGTLKALAKRMLFRAMKQVRSVRILTILPFDMDPRYAEVADDWIYDPQLWDLWVDGPPVLPDTDLSRRVEIARQGRKVMIFIGGVNLRKGFDSFVDTAEAEGETTLFVSAGRVSPECAHHAVRLRELRMMVEDRFVTDDEILSLYKVADLAWCRYSPEYDQASGVFGRALQTGVEPVVREGSLLHRMKALVPGQGKDIVHTPGHPLLLPATRTADAAANSAMADVSLKTLRDQWSNA